VTTNRTLVTLAAALLLATPAAATQQRNDDPRFNPDPTESADPRSAADPTEVEDPTAPLEGEELFDDLLERDALGELRLVMGTNPWHLLPYIDGLCQRRLSMKETGADQTQGGTVEAAELEERVRLVADLADGVLRDTRFSPYVTTVLAWDDEQVAAHRQAQEWVAEARGLLEEALSPGEAREAITPIERAQQAARKLNDPVTRSTTLSLLGQVEANLGLADTADGNAREGIRVARSVRNLDAIWDGLGARYEGRMTRKDRPGARAVLWEMHTLAVESSNAEAAESVLDQLAVLQDPVIIQSQPRRVDRVHKPQRATSVAARPFWKVQRPRPVWTFR
jgi:hypothetical protein